MSTTLVPPVSYEITPPNRPMRRYRNPAEAAAALIALGPRAEVMVVIAGRRRAPTESESRELARYAHAWRRRLELSRRRPAKRAAQVRC